MFHFVLFSISSELLSLCCACHCVMLLPLCCSVVIMLYCYCVALLLFVLSYVLIVCTVPLPPGVNPIAVDKYINKNPGVKFIHICNPIKQGNFIYIYIYIYNIPSCRYIIYSLQYNTFGLLFCSSSAHATFRITERPYIHLNVEIGRENISGRRNAWIYIYSFRTVNCSCSVQYTSCQSSLFNNNIFLV